MTPNSSAAQNAGKAGGRPRLLIAAVAMYIIGVCMKQLPFFAALPLPAYLKSNGMILSIVLIIMVGIRSRGSFLSVNSARAYYPFILYSILTTAIMSLVLYKPLGTLYGETTISVSTPAYLWLSMMLLAILALSHLFNQVGVEVLDVAFEALTLFVVVVGLIQVLDVVAGVPLYRLLMATGFFQDIFNGRISTIGTEPSSNGGILCMLALPFTLSKVMLGSHWRFSLYAVILTFLIFFVSSSQCYIAFFALVLGFIIVYRKRLCGRKFILAISLMGIMCCVAFLYISISGSDVLASEPVQELKYYLFEKAVDRSNGSTVNRSSTLVNDLLVFLHFPLFGCGEGIQGFFFNENVARYAALGEFDELSRLLSGELGVVGPGCFITAILSSFGLAGMFLFLRALCKSLLEGSKLRERIGGYYEMVLMSLCAAIPMGFIGLPFAGSWIAYIVLALACLRPRGF